MNKLLSWHFGFIGMPTEAWPINMRSGAMPAHYFEAANDEPAAA